LKSFWAIRGVARFDAAGRKPTAMSQMVGVADVAWEVFQRHTLP
jgi:hypothetical protein